MKNSFRLYSIPILLCIGFSLSAQIVNIEDRRIKGTNDSTYWYGSLQVGGAVYKVKDRIAQFNLTGHIQYKQNKALTLLLADANLLHAGDQDFDKKAFAHLRFNYDLSERLVGEAFTQAQYNKLLLINLRGLLGAGLRYRFLKSENGKHRIYGGLSYLYEYNDYLEEILSQSWSRMSSYLSFSFRLENGLTFISTTYFQPQVADIANYRFASESKLDSPIWKNLSFHTAFNFTKDQSLPQEDTKTIYRWTNGLTYRF